MLWGSLSKFLKFYLNRTQHAVSILKRSNDKPTKIGHTPIKQKFSEMIELENVINEICFPNLIFVKVNYFKKD